MGRQMDRELLQHIYDFEWELRDRLTGWLQVPLGVATLLGGAVVFLASNYRWDQSHASYAFGVGLAITVAALLACIAFLAASFHNFKYPKLPDAGELKKHYDELAEHHRAWRYSDAVLERSFSDFIERRLIRCATQNSKNNVIKAEMLHRATRSLLYALIGLLASAVPFIFQSVTAEQRCETVLVTQCPTQETPDDNRKRDTSGQGAAAAGSGADSGARQAP